MPFLEIIKRSIFFGSINNVLNRAISTAFKFSLTTLHFGAEIKTSHVSSEATFH